MFPLTLVASSTLKYTQMVSSLVLAIHSCVPFLRPAVSYKFFDVSFTDSSVEVLCWANAVVDINSAKASRASNTKDFFMMVELLSWICRHVLRSATSSYSLTRRPECPRDCEHTALLRFFPNKETTAVCYGLEVQFKPTGLPKITVVNRRLHSVRSEPKLVGLHVPPPPTETYSLCFQPQPLFDG